MSDIPSQEEFRARMEQVAGNGEFHYLTFQSSTLDGHDYVDDQILLLDSLNQHSLSCHLDDGRARMQINPAQLHDSAGYIQVAQMGIYQVDNSCADISTTETEFIAPPTPTGSKLEEIGLDEKSADMSNESCRDQSVSVTESDDEGYSSDDDERSKTAPPQRLTLRVIFNAGEKANSKPQTKGNKGKIATKAKKAKKATKPAAKRKFIPPSPVPPNLQAAIEETLERASRCPPGAVKKRNHAMTPLVRFLIEEVRGRRKTYEECRALLKRTLPQWDSVFDDDFMTQVCHGIRMRCHLGDFEAFKVRARQSAPREQWHHVEDDEDWNKIFKFWFDHRSMSVSELATQFHMARSSMDRLIKQEFIPSL